MARLEQIEHLGDRLLRVVFSDGLVRELDFAGVLPEILASIGDDTTLKHIDDTMSRLRCGAAGGAPMNEHGLESS